MKKLPIGIQDFSYLHELITQGKYFFLIHRHAIIGKVVNAEKALPEIN